MQDNTCLMPGEMGRTPPAAVGTEGNPFKGTAGWEKFGHEGGSIGYTHMCEDGSYGHGQILRCEPYPEKYPADQSAMICGRCGYTELYYKETTPPSAAQILEIERRAKEYNALKGRRMSINTGHTPPPKPSPLPINVIPENSDKPLSCGVCGGKGCAACQGTGMFIPRKTYQGNTPGGPACEPAPPPPGVEAEGCQCGCCDGEEEQPVTQSPPPTLPYRVVTDFPERLFELLQASAEGMGVEVGTFVRFAVDDYIRRRRN